MLKFIQTWSHEGVTHIPCDKYFLTALMKHWCNNTNTFYLSMVEMTITLDDIHCILRVHMKGTLIQRATLSIAEMEDYFHQLIGVQDYQQQKKGALLPDTLYMPLEDIYNACWFQLYVIILINMILCSDKNHEFFHTGLILIMRGIFLHGERYGWMRAFLQCYKWTFITLFL